MTPHWVGLVGTGLIMLAFVPQITLLLKTRRAGGLSIRSNVFNTAASAVLLAYALLRDDVVFIAVMAYQVAAASLILVLNIVYRGDRA
jgi:uncharacterized protein with PQ loop repeat